MEGYRYFHFEVHIELKFEILLALDIYNHNFVTFIIQSIAVKFLHFRK